MADHNHKLEWRNERIVNTDAWREACRCVYCHEEFVPASKLSTESNELAIAKREYDTLLTAFKEQGFRLHQLSEDHSHCEDLKHELGERASRAEDRLQAILSAYDNDDFHEDEWWARVDLAIDCARPVERPLPKYDGADWCNDLAPWPTEIRCKLPPGHDGDHSDRGPASWPR